MLLKVKEQMGVRDYAAIAVMGMTALRRAGEFSIRVFAQISSRKASSIASQGSDVACCYVNLQDACTAGCNAACLRATTLVHSSATFQVENYRNGKGFGAQDCSDACIQACLRPDDGSEGKFSSSLVRLCGSHSVPNSGPPTAAL